MSVPPTKFEVPIYTVGAPAKVPKEVTAQLKGAVSGKMVSRMKKEAVRCPVVNDEVTFLVCFTCPSFLRRVKGVVHCAAVGPPTYYKPSKK
ncbi:MAG: hypothetical protein ABSG92_05145 [Conexivisphaerales archaeon]